MRKSFRNYAGIVLLVTSGCAESPRSASVTEMLIAPTESTSPMPDFAYTKRFEGTTPSGGDVETSGMSGMGMMGMSAGTMMAQAASPAFPESNQAAFPADETVTPLPVAADRKIIYNADVSMIVESLDPIEASIAQLVERSRGYIADQNVTGSPGAPRSARWKVRIPVEVFEAFLRDLLALGELETNRRTSEDVTEQYFDLDARVRNKQVEEQRLIEILQETTGKLDEVLQVEAQLSRVRGEIEQFQGRLRLLANLTSLTTVTIQARERVKFEPPPPVVADFRTQVARAFHDSLDELRRLGESLVVFAAAWGLWLVVVVLPTILIGLVILRIMLRVLFRILRKSWQQSRDALTRLGPG